MLRCLGLWRKTPGCSLLLSESAWMAPSLLFQLFFLMSVALSVFSSPRRFLYPWETKVAQPTTRQNSASFRKMTLEKIMGVSKDEKLKRNQVSVGKKAG